MNEDLHKLQAIIEASKRLTATLDLDELLNIILDVALSELKAKRGTVFLLDEEKQQIYSRILRGDEITEIRLPLGTGIAGHVVQTGETVIIDDAYSDERFDPEVDRRTGFRTKSILCAPLLKGDHIIGGLQLLNHERGHFTEADAEFLSALAAHIVIAIENARAHLERIEQEKTAQEMEVAARIQQNLLPEGMPAFTGMRLHTSYIPCRAVGGDIYEYFTLPDDRAVVVLADVSGKGVPAALITAALHAYMQALIDSYKDPAEFCARLNSLLYGSTPMSSYATLVFVEYDSKKNVIKYANCGHQPIALVSNGGCSMLGSTSTVVGLLPKGKFASEEVTVQSGDMLVLYTDGLTEAATPESMESDDEDPVEFGVDRIQEICRKVDRDPEVIVNALGNAVEKFTRNEPLADDLTMIAMQFGMEK